MPSQKHRVVNTHSKKGIANKYKMKGKKKKKKTE